MTLSPLDDYPVHQVPEPIRFVGTTDRHFYDRYYFNMHSSSGDLFLVFGMGQYPNLGTQDAFVVATRKGIHRVVRASRELGADRMDTSVGPFRIEVIEGLKKLRFIVGPNEHGIEMDVTWEGSCPAHLEPKHYIRTDYGRVTFDTQRLAQTGFWSGSFKIGDETFDVTPDRWWGARDRSWGVRPVGEPEHPGIRTRDGASAGGLWLYTPMQFRDFSIFCIAQETADGTRGLEEATRVWAFGHEREVEHLGRPEYEFEFHSGTREVKRARWKLQEPDGSPLVIEVEPLIPLHVGVGTGYGMDADWRHGMYQGELVVQGLQLDTGNPADAARLRGLIDAAAKYTVNGEVGYGLFEYSVNGRHDPLGFKDANDVAP